MKHETIKEALKDAARSPFSPFFVVKSKAKTLRGVNAAITRVSGENDPFYESGESMERAMKSGFLSFHSDGFIVWVDE